jgi:Hpt domain
MTPVYLDTARAMAQIGDATALQELLTMLQSTLARDVEQIDQHLAAQDVAAANRLLHALKGFIPIFCADSLCTHVAQVEVLSKTGSASEVAQAYAPLRLKLQQLQLDVGAHLAT